MPQDPTSASATRFASDLRRIREERGVSIGDLHDETKIPIGLLEAFEQTALFDHPQFNRVYLRSFVRTYAQVIRIAADRAITALEEALDDRYEGALAVEYLGEEPLMRDAPALDEPAQLETVKPETPEKTKKPRKAGKKAATPPTEPGPEEPVRRAPEPEEDDKSDEGQERPRAFVSTTSVVAGAAESAEVEEDWTVQSPPSGRIRPGAVRPRPVARDDGSLRIWGYIAVAVVGFGLIIWLVTLFVGGSAPGEGEAGVAADTMAADSPAVARPATPPPSRPVPVLGDTMTFYVVASGGKLDPVRVTVDSDLRRPYWLEQGDSMRFDAMQRIIVEDLLENVRLSLLGVDYPVQRTDEQGRVVVTRDSAIAFLNRLR